MADQGAGGGGGQAAGGGFVKFSRGAAQRIAKAVRVVEGGDRNQPPIEFDHPQFGGGGKQFRVCTFTGSWNKNSLKTVTFKYQTNTPNTCVANNVFVDIAAFTTATAVRNCAIAREGTAWFLIAAEC